MLSYNYNREDMMKEAIFDCRKIACYILNEYEEKYGKNISEIKLQKIMYFLYAYWGGFIEKNKTNEVEEKLDYSPYLFDAKFKAWVYGPVLPEIYKLGKEGKIKSYEADPKILFKDKEFVKETIDSLLEDLFEISDFKLVSLSHDDNSWKKNFDINAPTHDKIIDNDEIIKEYASKETL